MPDSSNPRKKFKVIACAELKDAVDGTASNSISPSVITSVAPIEFGQVKFPDNIVSEYPTGGWGEEKMSIPETHSYGFPDATVYGEQGFIVVKDKYIVEECLRLCYFNEDSIMWDSDGSVTLPTVAPSVHVVAGQSLASGWPGNRNYAHWIVDILPGCFPPFSQENAVFLLPKLRHIYQNQSIDLADVGHKSLFIEPNGAVSCDRLYVNPSYIVDPGHFPHPARKFMIENLRSSVEFKPDARRKVFISRKDAPTRIYREEDLVIDLLTHKGFEIHTLTGKSFSDQIKLFSEAEVVIGAHGAGMANICFCRPGTVFLELFYNTYVQWSMRRLASTIPLRYGCLIGEEVNGTLGPWAKEWTLDVSQIDAAINDIMKQLT